jgi:hypothetical protein
MGDFFVLQMDDTFTESVCLDTSKEGKGELRPHAPPYSAKGKAKGRSPVPWEVWELRPYERSRCDEHGVTCSFTGSARPIGGSHARTTDAPAQCLNVANLRATLEAG